jgi:hypothetical protein
MLQMKNISPREESRLEDQALLIAGEIFGLIDKYTNDSNISKFFLTDEIADSCYALAGGFAALVYTPSLDPEEIQDTQILSFLYALITYGFNIYLKERSFLTNSAPYSLPIDKKTIKKVQKNTLLLTSKAKLASTPLLNTIIDIILQNITDRVAMEDFRIKKHRVNKKKFLSYSKLSLYWGYNFGKQLLAERRTTQKPSTSSGL